LARYWPVEQVETEDDMSTSNDVYDDPFDDPEVIALVDREREWERRAQEYAWADMRALRKGVRNAVLIALPMWWAVGRLMQWW
jgi:hypothetical protein